jgi:hypothetical protein
LDFALVRSRLPGLCRGTMATTPAPLLLLRGVAAFHIAALPVLIPTWAALGAGWWLLSPSHSPRELAVLSLAVYLVVTLSHGGARRLPGALSGRIPEREPPRGSIRDLDRRHARAGPPQIGQNECCTHRPSQRLLRWPSNSSASRTPSPSWGGSRCCCFRAENGSRGCCAR